MDAKLEQVDGIVSDRFSTMDAKLMQRPGDHFVSVPFNLVVLITLGLISVHNRRLGCIISFIAVATYLCSTVQQISVYSGATWREKPCSEVTQLDVTDFLILGLVRWISSLLFAAFVCKAVCRVLPASDVARIVRSNWFIVLPICAAVVYRGASELATLRPVTGDCGIYYHFGSAQVMEGVRAAFQVALVFTSQMQAVSMRREALARCMAHIFICSSFIIVQNILTYEINLYSSIDIALQLLLMTKTLKQFLRYLYCTEMVQTFIAVGAHLLITLSAMLVAIYSAVNLVATQFFRACQQYYIWLWQDERHEPYRPVEETERDYPQGEMVYTCDTIIPRYISSPEVQDPHIDCAKLALCISHNMPVPPQLSGPILTGPDDEEHPPIKPTPSATIDKDLVEVETSLQGTLLNREVRAQ